MKVPYCGISRWWKLHQFSEVNPQLPPPNILHFLCNCIKYTVNLLFCIHEYSWLAFLLLLNIGYSQWNSAHFLLENFNLTDGGNSLIQSQTKSNRWRIRQWPRSSVFWQWGLIAFWRKVAAACCISVQPSRSLHWLVRSTGRSHFEPRQFVLSPPAVLYLQQKKTQYQTNHSNLVINI